MKNWQGGATMQREQTTIRLPAELKERVQRQADEMGHSFNSAVLYLIDKGLETVSQKS